MLEVLLCHVLFGFKRMSFTDYIEMGKGYFSSYFSVVDSF